MCPIFYNMDPFEETHKNNMSQPEKTGDSDKVRVWRKALQKLYNQRLPWHLFCWYTFKKAKPPNDLEELLHRILQSLSGTPLAIMVTGCHLYGRSDTEEWKEAIVRLEKKDVSYEQLAHTTMTISYEGLDASEKTTFVLISCFLNGKERDEIVEVLSDSGQTFGGCIDVLVSKCLVCVDRTKLWVHGLAREMAMKILGSISPLIKSRQFDQCIPKGLKNSEIQSIARSIFLEIMEDDKCYSDQEGTNGAK